MTQLFDKDGMLILRQQFDQSKKKAKKTKSMHHQQYGSIVRKVMVHLSEFSVGDKISVSNIRNKTGIIWINQILWALSRDGFIEWERSGKGRKSSITILKKI